MIPRRLDDMDLDVSVEPAGAAPVGFHLMKLVSITPSSGKFGKMFRFNFEVISNDNCPNIYAGLSSSMIVNPPLKESTKFGRLVVALGGKIPEVSVGGSASFSLKSLIGNSAVCKVIEGNPGYSKVEEAYPLNSMPVAQYTHVELPKKPVAIPATSVAPVSEVKRTVLSMPNVGPSINF